MGPKIFVGPKKVLGPKNVVSEKNFGTKKVLGLKTIFGLKKQFWWKKKLGRKKKLNLASRALFRGKSQLFIAFLSSLEQVLPDQKRAKNLNNSGKTIISPIWPRTLIPPAPRDRKREHCTPVFLIYWILSLEILSFYIHTRICTRHKSL